MILFIDTSTSYLSLALLDGEEIFSKYLLLENSMSENTLKEINNLLKEINKKVNNITKVIAVSGPGSFTGIRIGLSIAKTISYSLNIPLILVSKLELMAIHLKGLVVPLIFARRGNVYAGIYQNGNNIFSDRFISIIDLKKELNNYNEYSFISSDIIPDISSVIYKPDFKLIFNTFKDREETSPFIADALYLKKTKAEEDKND